MVPSRAVWPRSGFGRDEGRCSVVWRFESHPARRSRARCAASRRRRRKPASWPKRGSTSTTRSPASAARRRAPPRARAAASARPRIPNAVRPPSRAAFFFFCKRREGTGSSLERASRAAAVQAALLPSEAAVTGHRSFLRAAVVAALAPIALASPALAQPASSSPLPPPAPSAAPAPAPAASAAVQGVVRSAAGDPLPGATIVLTGPVTASATSDANGAFSLGVPPGVYHVDVRSTGYLPAQLNDLALVAGTNQPLTIALTRVSLTSLQTIGSTTAIVRGSGSAINTGAAESTFVPGRVPKPRQPADQRRAAAHPGRQHRADGQSARHDDRARRHAAVRDAGAHRRTPHRARTVRRVELAVLPLV